MPEADQGRGENKEKVGEPIGRLTQGEGGVSLVDIDWIPIPDPSSVGLTGDPRNCPSL